MVVITPLLSLLTTAAVSIPLKASVSHESVRVKMAAELSAKSAILAKAGECKVHHYDERLQHIHSNVE